MIAGKVVKDMRVLNAMARRGLIKLDRATGETVRWYFGNVKAYYVDDYGPSAEPWKARYWSEETGSCFLYGGWYYRVEYINGCFCPFVIKVKKKGEDNEKTNTN